MKTFRKLLTCIIASAICFLPISAEDPSVDGGTKPVALETEQNNSVSTAIIAVDIDGDLEHVITMEVECNTSLHLETLAKLVNDNVPVPEGQKLYGFTVDNYFEPNRLFRADEVFWVDRSYTFHPVYRNILNITVENGVCNGEVLDGAETHLGMFQYTGVIPEGQNLLGWTIGDDPTVYTTEEYYLFTQDTVLHPVFSDNIQVTVLNTGSETGTATEFVASGKNVSLFRFNHYVTVSDRSYVMGWMIDGSYYSRNENYTFTHDTEISPVLGNVYKITVDAGEGTYHQYDGKDWFEYLEEQEYFLFVNITNYLEAPEHKYVTGFMINGSFVSIKDKYNFTADTTVYAVYDNLPMITVDYGGGSGITSFETRIEEFFNIETITAQTKAPEGKLLVEWIDTDGNHYSKDQHVYVTGDISLMAVYVDLVSITLVDESGNVLYTHESGKDEYVPLESFEQYVTVPENKAISGWKVTNENGQSRTYSYGDYLWCETLSYTVRPVFADLLQIRVFYGEGDSDYYTRTVKADVDVLVSNLYDSEQIRLPEGEGFVGWRIGSRNSQEIVRGYWYYKFTYATDVYLVTGQLITVTAQYQDHRIEKSCVDGNELYMSDIENELRLSELLSPDQTVSKWEARNLNDQSVFYIDRWGAVTVTSPLEITPVISRKVTITINPGEGTFSGYPSDTEIASEGEEYDLGNLFWRIDAPQGKCLIGWKISTADDPNHVYDSNERYVFTEDTTITAVFGDYVTVALQLDGETIKEIKVNPSQNTYLQNFADQMGNLENKRIVGFVINGKTYSTWEAYRFKESTTVTVKYSNAYKVTFLDTDGNVLTDDTAFYEGSYYELDEYSRNLTVPEDKALLGWVESDDPYERVYYEWYRTSRNVTLKPVLADKITVTFHYSDTVEDKLYTFAKGGKINLGNFMNEVNLPEGQYISGWKTDRSFDSNKEYSSYETITATENMMITPVISTRTETEQKMYTITYHPGEGTGETVQMQYSEGAWVPSGNTCNYTHPEGKDFIGWAIGSPDAPIGTYNQQITADTDYYAVWGERTHIYYKAADGELILLSEHRPNSFAYIYYTRNNIPVSLPEDKGVIGWKNVKTGEVYEYDQKVVMDEDIILEAVFADPITITYDCGEYGIFKEQVLPGWNVNLKWGVENLGSDKKFENWADQDGNIVGSYNNYIIEDTTLYAVISEADIKLTIDFGGYPSSDYQESVKNVVKGRKYYISDLGYINAPETMIFVGWRIGDSDTVYGMSDQVSFDSDTVIHAVFQEKAGNTVTIRYMDATGEKQIAMMEVLKGETVNLYGSYYMYSTTGGAGNTNIAGWRLNSPDGEYHAAHTNFICEEDTVFYAVEAESVTVTFHTGERTYQETFNAGTRTYLTYRAYNQDIDGTRNFTGWRIGSPYGEEVSEPCMINGDMDLYASYDGESPTVTVTYQGKSVKVPTFAGFIDSRELRAILAELEVPADKVFYGFEDEDGNMMLPFEIEHDLNRLMTGMGFAEEAIYNFNADCTLKPILADAIAIRVHEADSIIAYEAPKNREFSLGYYVYGDLQQKILHRDSIDGTVVMIGEKLNLNSDLDIYVEDVENPIANYIITTADQYYSTYYSEFNPYRTGSKEFINGYAKVGETVALDLNEDWIPVGKKFVKWVPVRNVQIADVYNPHTTFVCKDTLVGIYPLYEDMDTPALKDDSSTASMNQTAESVAKDILDGKIDATRFAFTVPAQQAKEILAGEGTVTTKQKSQVISENSVSQALQKVISEESLTLAQLYDITVLFGMDTGKAFEEIGQLYQLDTPVTLQIAVPENLPEVQNGFERKYHVITDHQGTVTEVDATVEDAMILFTVDRFSQYAVTYRDVPLHNHVPADELSGRKEATCTEDGYTGDKVCSICNEILEKGQVIQATGHTPEEGRVNTVDPTCTENGYSGDIICEVCGSITEKGTVIPALGHKESEQKINVVKATCTADGYTGDTFCERCHEIIGNGEIEQATGHTPSQHRSNVVAPTCTEKGYSGDLLCTVCGEIAVKGEIVPSIGHKPAEERVGVKSPTCTEDGYTGDIICTVCNEVVDQGKVIQATGHNPDKERVNVKDPTCTEEGYTGDIICTVCNEVVDQGKVIPATGHNPAKERVNVKEATEETKGYTGDLLCEVCGEVVEYGEIIPVLPHEHIPSETVTGNKQPTCTEDGYTGDIVCTKCGETVTPGKSIPSTGHSPAKERVNVKAPTCTEEGYSGDVLCEVCGEIAEKGEVIEALGHEEVIDAGKEATCTEEGLTEGKHCSRCNEVLVEQEVIEALGHEEVIDERKEPTCTETGFTEGKHCSRCNEVLVKQEVIEALGHEEAVDAGKEATCTEDGLTEGKHCSRCNEVLVKQEVIPANGHSYDNHVCSICHEIEKGYAYFEFADGSGKEVNKAVSFVETKSAYASEAGKKYIAVNVLVNYETQPTKPYKQEVKVTSATEKLGGYFDTDTGIYHVKPDNYRHMKVDAVIHTAGLERKITLEWLPQIKEEKPTKPQVMEQEEAEKIILNKEVANVVEQILDGRIDPENDNQSPVKLEITVNEVKTIVNSGGEIKPGDPTSQEVPLTESTILAGPEKIEGKVLCAIDVTIPLIAKKAGEADRIIGNMTELSEPTQFVVELPELPEVADGYTREFEVYRNHKGDIKKVDAYLDANGNLVVTSSLFSEYVITYRDVVKPVNPGRPAVDTADRTGILFYGLLAVFGAVAAVAVILFRKKHA